MHNPLLIKTFTANGAIAARRIVCLESDKDVSQATDESAVNLGVTELACNAGDSVDVVLSGIVDVKAGGTIARGDWVTSDAEGRAVAVNVGVFSGTALGVAVDSAAEGEMVSVNIAPQQPAGASGSGGGNETVSTFKTVKIIAAGTIVAQSGRKVVVPSSGTANVIGVAKTATEAIVDKGYGDPIDVVVAGIAEVTAAGAIRVGDRVTASSSSDGLAVQAGEYDNVLGVALGDAAAGETVAVVIERDRRRVDQVIPTPSYTAFEFPVAYLENVPNSMGLGEIGFLTADGVVESRNDLTKEPIGVCVGTSAYDNAIMAVSGICAVDCRTIGVDNSPVNSIAVGDYVGALPSNVSYGAGAVTTPGSWYIGKAVIHSDQSSGMVYVLIKPGQIPSS